VPPIQLRSQWIVLALALPTHNNIVVLQVLGITLNSCHKKSNTGNQAREIAQFLAIHKCTCHSGKDSLLWIMKSYCWCLVIHFFILTPHRLNNEINRQSTFNVDSNKQPGINHLYDRSIVNHLNHNTKNLLQVTLHSSHPVGNNDKTSSRFLLTHSVQRKNCGMSMCFHYEMC